MAERAKAAAAVLAGVHTADKNRWLLAAADALEARTGELLDGNAKDVAAAPEYGLGAAVWTVRCNGDVTMASMPADASRLAAAAACVRPASVSGTSVRPA